MLRFTVLTENQDVDGLECEHGLSFYIEYKEKKYLLDAGKSAVFWRNADKLGLDLQLVEVAVLSHAHYDHADGFAEFLERNPKAKVYARREGKMLDCYSVGEEQGRYIGINPEILKKYGERFCWVGETGDETNNRPGQMRGREIEPAGYGTNNRVKIANGVWLLGHSMPGLDKIGAQTGMYREDSADRITDADGNQEQEMDCVVKVNKRQVSVNEKIISVVPDNFTHEQSLVMETDEGLAIFNSCSHGGVENIVKEVRAAFPDKKITAYIGGFHLKAPGKDDLNCPETEVEQLGYSLMELGIQKIYTGHCTGNAGFEILKRVMGDGLYRLYPGLVGQLCI